MSTAIDKNLMTSATIGNSAYQSVPNQQLSEIDEFCDRFDLELVTGDGQRIESFLAEASEAAHDGLLAELLAMELEREMLTVGSLQNPNIIQALDAGEINGAHYLSMEYVEGQDLQQFIQTQGTMSVVDACEAIRQTALGLAAAHRVGLVHRDIKPSNLFVTKQTGQIKILDMGLALLAQAEKPAALTFNGQCFGTPDYMAPEQWSDAHTCDARSDLYSLGCTLYFLLVGRPPYHSETHRSTANKMKGHMLDAINHFARFGHWFLRRSLTL